MLHTCGTQDQSISVVTALEIPVEVLQYHMFGNGFDIDADTDVLIKYIGVLVDQLWKHYW